MVTRPLLGGFIPSAGVGTGYRRDALQKLAEASSNRVFEPEALTEDYENGLKLFRLGCSQAFVPLSGSQGSRNFVATREFFPADFRSALRQRTRWVMGIALQGWERYGWRGKPGEVYWLWRDRKGLLANPLSLLSNVVFVYGLATGIWMRAAPLAARLVTMTVCVMILRLAVRMACSARIYGWFFALGVPVRAVYANVLNSAATFLAVAQYAWARAHRRPLKWLKTDHAFPNRAALLAHKRRLGEILVGSSNLSAAALKVALRTQPANVRLGEHLVSTGQLNETDLYDALSLQQGLPVADPDPSHIPRGVARALPEHVTRRWRVVPFRIVGGSLHLAGPDAPPDGLNESLRPFTSLEIRFHLVTPRNFAKLTKALL
jgi:adsorption protein B